MGQAHRVSDMTDLTRERRRTTRYQVTAGESLALPLSVPVEILDVSEAGLLLRSPYPMEVAKQCRLKLRLGRHAWVADVEVSRCAPPVSPEDGFRIGAVFTTMTGEDHQLLRQFLDRKFV
jgi:hypothetical protein